MPSLPPPGSVTLLPLRSHGVPFAVLSGPFSHSSRAAPALSFLFCPAGGSSFYVGAEQWAQLPSIHSEQSADMGLSADSTGLGFGRPVAGPASSLSGLGSVTLPPLQRAVGLNDL